VAESSSSGPKIKADPDTQDLAREFDGLNVEDDGRISFHGPTSLFQLPSGAVNETASSSHYAQELEARKERLVNSAWRERAFEQMAAMPVLFLVDCQDTLADIACRNLINIFSTLTGAGFSHCGISSIVLRSHVRPTLALSDRDKY
jgi:hypothetical protein